MANNFITNSKGQKTLRSRLNTLIGGSKELKFLVGFFYFSGWEALYEKLRENDTVQLKLLIGLQVEERISQSLIEHDDQEKGLSQEDVFNQFMSSMSRAVNSKSTDTQAFYNQVLFFLQMIEEGRLQMKKTINPNHAKLYIFNYEKKQADFNNKKGEFITGSSNLTRSGLSVQEEFNVEIKDYGAEEANKWFDELWEPAVPITEIEQRKQQLVQFIQYKSQAANVTPYEAYALILKTYLDLQQQKRLKPQVEELLEKAGYKKFTYQTDAVNQALSIIEEYNGIIIADVVGLGKSVIASMIAKNLDKRGMVICPPGLIGNKNHNTGWWSYINGFKLWDWDVKSSGSLTELDKTIHNKEIEVVIIDEAHKFRNQDTDDYEALLNICRDKIVIQLTATPFNNSPTDIFSLLKLFIIPGKSGITLEDNIESRFAGYNSRFGDLSYIIKNYQSDKDKNRDKAEKKYIKLLGNDLPVDVQKVRDETARLAHIIKNIISPVVIRRNRIDLREDYEYAKEITTLSEVEPPIELFFRLSEKQNEFYDKILNNYFAPEDQGKFKGAIYRPALYKKLSNDENNMDEEENRAYQQQRNLYDFMRRLLVKRFESSFGAFKSSISRFIEVHEVVERFIKKSEGKFILDRKLMEKIYENDSEIIEEELERYKNELEENKTQKNNTVYNIKEFERETEFKNDIENDKQLFKDIKREMEEMKLVDNDPKREAVADEVESSLQKNAKRKIIIFSEYVDTVNHLSAFFSKKFNKRVLICDGKISSKTAQYLDSDFNAQYNGERTDHFDVLITSDKLSEGVNLNRAGAIINYDIPWNPTRVIQRVGRINRIGTKVFDKLFIYNFFPSEQGASVVKSREIASQKMFLIHNSLGEDAQIFDTDEKPTAAGLYQKINQTPEADGEVGVTTQVRNDFHKIKEEHPEVIDKISQLPARVKSARKTEQSQLNVLRKKGLGLFTQIVKQPQKENNEVEEISFKDLLPYVRCRYEDKRMNLSSNFWPAYETVKTHYPKFRKQNIPGKSRLSETVRNLKWLLKISPATNETTTEFIKTLIEDFRNYHTLSDNTLGKLGGKYLKDLSKERRQKKLLSEIEKIRKRLGDNYLENIKKRVQHQREEVIIAIENRE